MGSGLTPIIVFYDGSTTGGAILWTASSNIQAPDVSYDFEPTDGDMNPGNYTNSGTTYTYTPVTPPALPNVEGFELAVWTDSTLTASTKLQLANFFPLLEAHSTNAPMVEQFWTDLVAEAPSWLTSQVQTIVEGYASTYNIPL